jgi:predicted metal-dependent HD superfamily phosphohydrolase
VTDAVAARWAETWSLAEAPAPRGALDELCVRLGEPHRAYHTLDHVLACLADAASVRDALAQPALVELALWYHDAVYDPRRDDNEAASAALAVDRLSTLDATQAQRVGALVLVTRHPSRPVDEDAKHVVDIDLAILGASPSRFDAYEAAIRTEYAFVQASVYRQRRRALLESFLACDRIYLTDRFRDRLEATARRNLARSIVTT